MKILKGKLRNDKHIPHKGQNLGIIILTSTKIWIT